MRWFWLWRLRVANRHLEEVLDRLPPFAFDDPAGYVEEIAEWAEAHKRVARLLEKFEPEYCAMLRKERLT